MAHRKQNRSLSLLRSLYNKPPVGGDQGSVLPSALKRRLIHQFTVKQNPQIWKSLISVPDSWIWVGTTKRITSYNSAGCWVRVGYIWHMWLTVCLVITFSEQPPATFTAFSHRCVFVVWNCSQIPEQEFLSLSTSGQSYQYREGFYRLQPLTAPWNICGGKKKKKTDGDVSVLTQSACGFALGVCTSWQERGENAESNKWASNRVSFYCPLKRLHL